MRRTVLFGFAALAAAFAATAATIPSRSPYHPAAAPSTAARLAAPGQEGLDFDATLLPALRDHATRVLEMDGFPVAPGATGKVRLHRFEIATPGAQMTIEGPDGVTSRPLPEISHFAGVVEGEPDSSVYLAATKDGVVAWVHSRLGHAYVGPDESGRSFVVRDGDSPLNAAASTQPWVCQAENLPAALSTPAPSSIPAPQLPDVTFKQASVRVETDYQLYQHFGGDADAMSTYVMTLFGAVNVIYTRDLSLYLAVSEIHVWSTPDPYTGGDTLTQLYQLGTWWHANKPIASNPRTYVHYLSGHPVAGGIAWVDVLCSGDFQATATQWGGGYGLTQVFGTYPLQLWDQDASAHEMGHNVGSVHTHCYAPPIDHCYSGEQGCYSGPVENPGLGNGTIMSYCHLLGWQYMSLVFHPRCISEQMMPGINGASCLTTPGIFADVLPSDPFLSYIDTVYNDGITGGCGTDPLIYCPTSPVTRAQMAVFLLKAIHGSSYAPPACAGLFTDVPCSNGFAPWIEELAAEGVTAGCGTGTYCPNDPVTRQQMAAFLLKAEHGSSYTPPACAANPFADVACPGTFTNWIQQLVAEAVTGGCGGGDYCPTSPVTRGQMAVFLVKTFGL
ncbi:MAG TPA: M12 family metallo-peptidase [Thermoanaerobaculia bacterium]|nr:M12 family metallo-peptidase [Thermoanaerobaculia bacterium]